MKGDIYSNAILVGNFNTEFVSIDCETENQ